ncbi:MAG: hypothetical protein HXX15_10795 [Rhodopseudomonas sp.]|uniref:hypothetical protein n=1 Tax=Rhodopseudomonas sp. TaxID=1078 RepID=UPI0017B2182F|nr:hypothetical protein [Rhodopseudomonas sp.]NVN86562.1 hypothetical protein [Rhodopseudomonas sp.]
MSRDEHHIAAVPHGKIAMKSTALPRRVRKAAEHIEATRLLADCLGSMAAYLVPDDRSFPL